MLVVFDAHGNLKKLTPSQIYQGSNKANQIYIVMPLSPTVVVQARFSLPNGKVTTPIVIPLAENTGYLGLTDADRNNVYVWSFAPQKALTAYAGNVTVQLEITNNEQKITSFAFDFNVMEGVPSINVTDIDSYEDIIAALQSINIAITNNFNTLESDITELENTKQNKTDYDLQTESKQVVGAINELNTEIEQIKDIGAGTTVTVKGQPVSIFNADTKLDLTAFEEYEAKIDAVLEQSNILTIDEISGEFIERKTANDANIVNNSKVEAVTIEGNSAHVSNILPTTLTPSSSSYGTITVNERAITFTVDSIPDASSERQFIRLTPENLELTADVYTLSGSPANSTENTPHLVLALYDKSSDDFIEQFEDFGDGITFSIDRAYYYVLYICFGHTGYNEGSIHKMYASLKRGNTSSFINSQFSGLKSTSEVLPRSLSIVNYNEHCSVQTSGRQARLTVNSLSNRDERLFTRVCYGFLQAGTYTLSGSPANSTENTPHFIIEFKDKDDGPYLYRYEDFGEGVTFTIDKPQYYYLFICYKDYGANPGVKVGESYSMTASLKRIASDGSTLSVWNFPKTELPIGTTLNFQTKKKTNTWAEYTFKGDNSELWTKGGSAPTGYERWYTDGQLNNILKPAPASKIGDLIVCDRYPSIVSETEYNGWNNGIAVLRTANVININIIVPTSLADTITADTVRQLTKGMTVRYPTTSENTAWYKTEDFTQEQVNAGNNYEAFLNGDEIKTNKRVLWAGTYTLSGSYNTNVQNPYQYPHLLIALYDIETERFIVQYDDINGGVTFTTDKAYSCVLYYVYGRAGVEVGKSYSANASLKSNGVELLPENLCLNSSMSGANLSQSKRYITMKCLELPETTDRIFSALYTNRNDKESKYTAEYVVVNKVGG